MLYITAHPQALVVSRQIEGPVYIHSFFDTPVESHIYSCMHKHIINSAYTVYIHIYERKRTCPIDIAQVHLVLVVEGARHRMPLHSRRLPSRTITTNTSTTTSTSTASRARGSGGPSIDAAAAEPALGKNALQDTYEHR